MQPLVDLALSLLRFYKPTFGGMAVRVQDNKLIQFFAGDRDQVLFKHKLSVVDIDQLQRIVYATDPSTLQRKNVFAVRQLQPILGTEFAQKEIGVCAGVIVAIDNAVSVHAQLQRLPVDVRKFTWSCEVAPD